MMTVPASIPHNAIYAPWDMYTMSRRDLNVICIVLLSLATPYALSVVPRMLPPQEGWSILFRTVE